MTIHGDGLRMRLSSMHRKIMTNEASIEKMNG